MKPAERPVDGFTLVELLITSALFSLVAGLLLLVTYQFWNIPRQGNAQLAVDSDLRTAGLWLIQDGNESQAFTGSPGTCTPFVFDTGPGHSAVYTYTLSGDTLSRQDGSIGRTIGVARHVSSVQCPAGTTTGIVAVTLTSSSGDVSASQTFTVTMRVDE